MIFAQVSKVFFGCVILAWLLVPYASTALLTKLKSSDIVVSQVCEEGAHIAVLEYNKLNETAQIYCLYSDARKNTYLKIVQDGVVWRKDSATTVGKGWYWPFLL